MVNIFYVSYANFPHGHCVTCTGKTKTRPKLLEKNMTIISILKSTNGGHLSTPYLHEFTELFSPCALRDSYFLLFKISRAMKKTTS